MEKFNKKVLEMWSFLEKGSRYSLMLMGFFTVGFAMSLFFQWLTNLLGAFSMTATMMIVSALGGFGIAKFESNRKKKKERKRFEFK